MSEQALSIVGLNLPSTQLADDAVFNDLAKSNEFLSRLQLYTKGSAVNRKLIGPGEFGIPENDEQIIGLGESVDVIALARRPKALDMSDKDAIVVSYDAKSPTFQDIKARSGEQNSGCMWGVSFLFIERTTGRLVEFFCGTKSARIEAGKIYPFLPLSADNIKAKEAAGEDVSDLEPHGPLALTMKSKLVETAKYSWHVPVVVPCSTPFTRLPPVEQINDAVTKFLTVKDGGVEKAEPATGKSKRAR
jgi:hypothetical protein